MVHLMNDIYPVLVAQKTVYLEYFTLMSGIFFVYIHVFFK